MRLAHFTPYAVASALAVIACGRAERARPGEAAGGAGGDDDAPVAGSPSGGAPTTGGGGSDGGSTGRDGDSTSGTGGEPPGACEPVALESQPADVYVLLGRVHAATAPILQLFGDSLARFASEPTNLDLRLGLQYYPVRRAGVPTECRTDEDCGPGAPCVKVCSGSTPESPVYCIVNDDCGLRGPCEPINGPSSCYLDFSCEIADYARLDVEMTPLPEVAPAIERSIAAQVPGTASPIGPALEGAIQFARENAEQSPGRRAIVLVVTEEVWGSCSPSQPEAIAALATEGRTGTPPVTTFVVGVELRNHVYGRQAMHALAEAGGSDRAFVLEESTSDLGAGFSDALEQMRARLTTCAFQLPQPSSDFLDPALLRVELAEGDDPPDLVRAVGSDSECGNGRGWHYDPAPESGETPSALVLCPLTCSELQRRPAARMRVRTGCSGQTP